MPPYDVFVATVGVTLMESAGCFPLPQPLPAALPNARGWRSRGEGPPGLPAVERVVVVARADGLDGEGVAGAIAAWRTWLETFDPPEAILLLVTQDAPEDPEARGAWPDHPRWQAWQVDLAASRIDRATAEAAEESPLGAFGQAVDAAVVAYFEGPPMTLEDLAEEERALLAGKAPFLAFLDAQPAPASAVLFGIILGMFLITTWLTLGPDAGRYLAAPFAHGRIIADALMNPSQIALLRLGATFRPLVEQGELWRIVAANYLHAGLPHFLVCAFSVVAMGPALEKIFSTPKFVAIWTIAGAAGGAASALVNRDAASVGASGALFGLLGAMLALGVRYRGAIPGHQIRAIRHAALVILGFNLILGLTFPNVDNVAHLGGLAGGLAAAFVLGPHPLLIGRKPRFWEGKALWAFPLLAAMALSTGLAGTASGHMPAVPLVGPTRDYVVTMPIDAQVDRASQYLIARSTRGERFVLVHSVPNPEGQPAPGRPALTEATLDAREYDLARRYASQGARLVDRPAVVTGGHHKFLMIPVAMPEGGREEIYVTASPERIFAIRTRGLATDPWVRGMRDQVLATFRMRTPEPR